MVRVARVIEASVFYRAAVLSSVLLGVGAVTLEDAVPATTGTIGALLIVAGFAVSYARRGERNVLLKSALAVALFVAFGEFLRSVRGVVSFDEARLPLAELFLWVQVLHSYDVPRRRDLNFSLASSVTLMAMAGSVSISMRFGAVLVAYVAAAAVALALGHLSELRDRAGAGAAQRVRRTAGASARSGSVRPFVATASVLAVATTTTFAVLPRLPGLQVRSLPFSIVKHSPVDGFAGAVFNPGLRGARGGFSSRAYFGYGDHLDLRVRGRLDDDVVMRVRSVEGSFWRAQIYDRYSDGIWTSTDASPARIRAGLGNTVYLRDPDAPTVRGVRGGSRRFQETETFQSRSGGPPEQTGHELVQTFFVTEQLPNLAFHAYSAREVSSPATSVRVDRFGSIRLPFVLEPDTIYSVVSWVPDTPEKRLAGDVPGAGDREYLQLPGPLPARVRRLAHEITDQHPTILGKVRAVERWLKDNTRYRLDVPRDPPGKDPVDHFLFDRREGFCEQVASAMTILLREAGVEARLATGFAPGERNPFTGYWEVRNSDAHTWVEVRYPSSGWVFYDPTHEVPEAGTGPGELFVLKPLFRFAGSLVPRPVARAVGAAADAARSAPALPSVAIVLAIGVTVLIRGGRRPPRDPRAGAVRDWLRLERRLARAGVTRAPHETARELVAAARAASPPGVDLADVESRARAFELARYGELR